MNESRHAFVLTGSDQTRAAFSSVNASVTDMQKTVVSATELIATALGGVGIIAFTTQMGQIGEESLLVADRLGMTTEQITSLQYAASQFGLDGEAMNGVLQDMSIKIQEFGEIGTGEAADFFENLNLDVKDFIDLSPDELLLKVAKALDNVGEASTRVYLDQLGGDDLVSLLPALRNSAEGLKELRQEAYDTNKVLSQTDAIRLASIANEVSIFEGSVKSLSLQLAAEFEPTVKAISSTFKQFTDDEDAVATGLDIIGTSATVVSGIYLGRLVSGFVASTQAKYADIAATRQKLVVDVESARVALAAANQKLTVERTAYNQSLVAKRADIVASELESRANLDRLRTTQLAAASAVEDALALKANASAIEHNVLRTTRLTAAEEALRIAREKRKVSTDRLSASELRHSALITKNAASLEVLANTTKRVDRATTQAASKTQKLQAAQAAFNSTAKTGTVITRGLAGSMALLGGPIGLLTLAATTLGVYAMTAGASESDFDAAAGSIEGLQEKLKKAPPNELNAMLQQLQSEALATEVAMESISLAENTGSASPDLDLDYHRRTQNLQDETEKRNEILERESLVQTTINKRTADEAKKQAFIKETIISESLKKQIDKINDYGKSAADLRREAYQKEQTDIKEMGTRELISDMQLKSMLSASESKFNLEMEQMRNQQKLSTLVQFGTEYSQREKMGLDHQKRMIEYTKTTGITDEKDERLVAYWNQSYQYGLTALKNYQDGVLKEYRDYGKSALQLEHDRYAKEQTELKKHLKNQDITQAQYDKAEVVSTQRNSDSLEKIKQTELNSKITAQRDFANNFTGMADSENSKLAAIGKAASIYNIGLKTAEGAMAAFAGAQMLGPIVGPPVGVALSGAVIAYGVEQVANVNNQSYHTGGVAGQASDDYGQRLKAGEMNATLLINEEVLTADDPRHRKNLKLSNGSSKNEGGGITLIFGDTIVQVENTNANPNEIATITADKIASTVMSVLRTKKGEKAVYNGVAAEAGRNLGKIKGVRS